MLHSTWYTRPSYFPILIFHLSISVSALSLVIQIRFRFPSFQIPNALIYTAIIYPPYFYIIWWYIFGVVYGILPTTEFPTNISSRHYKTHLLGKNEIKNLEISSFRAKLAKFSTNFWLFQIIPHGSSAAWGSGVHRLHPRRERERERTVGASGAGCWCQWLIHRRYCIIVIRMTSNMTQKSNQIKINSIR